MKIRTVEQCNYQALFDFISPYESSCVQLSALVRKSSPTLIALTQTDQLTPTSILGVISADSTLLHCIPSKNLSLIDAPQLVEYLLNLEKPIKCISGEAVVSKFLIEQMELFEQNSQKQIKPYQINLYTIMTAASVISPEEPLFNDDQIIRCTKNDLENLIPIQKMYMNEEVVPIGKNLTDAEAAITLKQILKNQLCLALTSDNEIVAKANTNAIGFNWIQIGGVFTNPLYRRNGYAWQLVSAICRKVFSSGKSVSLYVKEKNSAANALYSKMGFKKNGQYLIAYFM